MSLIQFISYYLIDVMMSFTMVYFYSKLSNKKANLTLQKIIYILFLSFLILINNFYNIASFRFITSIAISLITNKIVFKDSYKNIIYYTFIYSILSILIELILSILLVNLTKSIDIFNNQVILKVFFSLLETILLLFIVKINSLINFVMKIKKNISFYFIGLTILLFCNILLVFRGNDINNIVTLLFSIMSIIYICVFVMTIVNDKYNLRILEEKNQNIKESYKAYSETIDQCKEFKHNIKNELYSLKSILPVKYQKNINNLLTKYDTKYEWINKIEEIPEGLQGIIYLKIKEAETKKVKIILNTKKEISANEKDYMDLCNILGILIDNAIDASILTKNKIIEININEAKEYTDIKMLNTFVNSIDLNNIGKKNYSTKKYKSGIGLNYIKNVKNNNIKVNFSIINNLFITNIKYIKN